MATAPKTPPKVTQMPAHGDLKQKMRDQIGKTAAPSMVPEIPAPPERTEEVIPDVKDLIPSAPDRLKLRKLVAEHIQFGQAKSAADKAQAPISEQIKKIVGTYKIGKALCDGNSINYYSVPRNTIKADLLRGFLLAHVGQPLTVEMVEKALEAATDTTVSYTLRVTPGKTD